MAVNAPTAQHALKNTKKQAQETGMAMVLLCLIVQLFWELPILLPLAVVLQVLMMTIPVVFKPLSIIWFGLSNKLGFIITNLILMISFFLIVTPVAIMRRAFGADPLLLKKWKTENRSIFKVRDHQFKSHDLFKPY